MTAKIETQATIKIGSGTNCDGKSGPIVYWRENQVGIEIDGVTEYFPVELITLVQPADLDVDVHDVTIQAHYQDGEYLTGYTVHGDAAKLLEALGLDRYVDGWGYLVADETIKALGTEFTHAQAVEFSRPARQNKADKIAAAQDERQKIIVKAQITGLPIVLDSYMSDDCNLPDCGYDSITVYAMPDGTTKTARSHSY